MARGVYFDANVDPGLLRAVDEVARGYKKHKVELFSGRAARPKNKKSLHPLGGAIDVNLYDPETGKVLPNIGDPASAQAYQAYANEVYKWALKNDPELAKEIQWGGYIAGGGWPQDWMHFQRGGTKFAGGDWQQGFNPEVMAKLGLQSSGGLGALDAQMQAAGYTPEQRRAAIASIESQGSGDYAARGKELGNDRALGRYQIMQSNLPEWSKQALGREVTAAEFMADPSLQDQIFDAIYGGYVSKYGERGAASKWFTGSENEPQRSDVHGKLTGESYADRYMKALGLNADSPSEGGSRFGGTGLGTPAMPTATGPKKKGFDWDKFAEGFGDASMGGGQSPMPYQSQPAPKAAVASAPAAPMVNPEMQQMQRERLAQALAMLQGGGYGQVQR